MPTPDDILEEPSQGARGNRRSRPSSVSPDGGGASDIDQGLENRPTSSAACHGLLVDMHRLSGAVAPPGNILDVHDDDLLLGDECFEDADLIAFQGG